ncbi:unnamed protein product [Prunus armeniaca]|uniref:Uncharacterized protein n=1 Tax=Prunus armeniaca TaxID=36596 RepID=A0A6J5TSZ6_PRUAR|nr:unnamed protein product [Prunus armeniaca]
MEKKKKKRSYRWRRWRSCRPTEEEDWDARTLVLGAVERGEALGSYGLAYRGFGSGHDDGQDEQIAYWVVLVVFEAQIRQWILLHKVPSPT